jgi:hypothetical protein
MSNLTVTTVSEGSYTLQINGGLSDILSLYHVLKGVEGSNSCREMSRDLAAAFKANDEIMKVFGALKIRL